MTTGSAGLIQDLYLTEVPDQISIGSTLRVGSGNVTDVEEVQVLNVFDGNVVRILRHTGIAHTLGSNVDVLNNEITIPVRTNKFISSLIEKFILTSSISWCWNNNGAIKVERVVGDIKNNTSIPTRTLHLPNHPFITGQKVILNKRNGANRFDVGRTPLVNEFKLPFLGQNSTEVFVINKGPDNIGLVTTRVGIGSTSEGLFFYSNGTNYLNILWFVLP